MALATEVTGNLTAGAKACLQNSRLYARLKGVLHPVNMYLVRGAPNFVLAMATEMNTCASIF